MKKLMVLIACLFSLQMTVRAGDDKPIGVKELPTAAQEFIRSHFKNIEVSFAQEDKDWLCKDYKVVFANGDKVEFDKNGQWKEVDCKYSRVPDAIVPQAIRNYVTKNYPDRKIIKIDKDTKDYEVELDNQLDLKFDLKFNLIAIDD